MARILIVSGCTNCPLLESNYEDGEPACCNHPKGNALNPDEELKAVGNYSECADEGFLPHWCPLEEETFVLTACRNYLPVVK